MTNIEQELIDFVGRQEGVFCLSEVVSWLADRLGGSIDEDVVEELLLDCPILFETDEVGEYVSRATVFRGAEFRITPTAEEVRGGYLVPGHRFMPFLSRTVFPADATLKVEGGAALERRVERFTYAQISRYFLYYGEYASINYFMADHEEQNGVALMHAEGEFSITVFDLKRFLEQSRFQRGDSLMLTVEDWNRGLFSVRRVAQSEPLSLDATRLWVQCLRTNLETVFQFALNDLCCDEQLAQMMYLCTSDFDDLKNPPMALATFVNQLKDIVVKPFGEVVFFCPIDESPEDFAGFDAEAVVDELMDGLSPFETVALGAGMLRREGEMEAYMRDALFRHECSPESVLERITRGRALVFDSEEDSVFFDEEWAALWQRVTASYLPLKDFKAGPLRADALVVLDLFTELVVTMESLGVDPDELEDGDALQGFVKIHSMLVALVEALNAEDPDPTLMDVEAMSGIVKQAFPIARAQCESLLAEAARRARR
jgi:hypothetical protein